MFEGTAFLVLDNQLAPKSIPYFLLIFADFQDQIFSSDLYISGKCEIKLIILTSESK